MRRLYPQRWSLTRKLLSNLVCYFIKYIHVCEWTQKKESGGSFEENILSLGGDRTYTVNIRFLLEILTTENPTVEEDETSLPTEMVSDEEATVDPGMLFY